MHNRFLLLFSLLVYSLNAQENFGYNYLGSLVLPNNTLISFSIHFNEEDGVVDGYSLTNINTPDETKSDLSGIYFKGDKSFQLQETQILSTSSEADLSTFCFIHTNISLKGRLGTKRLEGNFVGLFTNNDTCASGRVLLLEQEKLKKKIKRVKNKIERIKEERSTFLQTQQLKDGDNFLIEWENDNLRLFIWDANEEDGDKIQLKINNEIVLNDFTTKRKPKKIKYKLQKGENIIEIRAVNLGDSPPNTSRIKLVDRNTKYPIISQLTLDKSAIIIIMK